VKELRPKMATHTKKKSENKPENILEQKYIEKKTIHAYHSTLTEPIAWARPRNNTQKTPQETKNITYSSRHKNDLKRENESENTTKNNNWTATK
jgi:hypothetical protein